MGEGEGSRPSGDVYGKTSRKDDVSNTQSVMKASRSPAAGSIGRGLMFKKKADSWDWTDWPERSGKCAPPTTFDWLQRKHKLLCRTQNPYNETTTHLNSLSSQPSIPALMPLAFAFAVPCFLTPSLRTSRCQLFSDVFTDSLRHEPHLLHYSHGLLVISLWVQLPHICKL